MKKKQNQKTNPESGSSDFERKVLSVDKNGINTVVSYTQTLARLATVDIVQPLEKDKITINTKLLRNIFSIGLDDIGVLYDTKNKEEQSKMDLPQAVKSMFDKESRDKLDQLEVKVDRIKSDAALKINSLSVKYGFAENLLRFLEVDNGKVVVSALAAQQIIEFFTYSIENPDQERIWNHLTNIADSINSANDLIASKGLPFYKDILLNCFESSDKLHIKPTIKILKHF